MSYLSNCEMCTGQGSGGYAPMSGGYSSGPSYTASHMGYSSNLEYTVSHSEVAEPKHIESEPIQTMYKQKKYFEGYLNTSKLTNTYSSSSPFMLPNIETKFVGESGEIEELVEKAFRAVTGDNLPDDIIINVCSKDKLKEFHTEFGGSWSNGINGFAVNRKTSGQKSEIFVAKGQLSNVLATVGHEIGHCFSRPLDCIRDEEAKAFAFEAAWVKAIQEDNIGELRDCFNINMPAKNNVHDVAFDFVVNRIKNGTDALKLFFNLTNKVEAVQNG